jgi:23S rRNA (adenine2030-N6)-methyltransferase
MNYRHLYHAGSFSDVFKHFIFTELLLKLREKKTPFCVIDTHAGLGLYNIHSMEAQKTLEYQTGIEYFLQNASKDPDLDAYIRVIRSVNGSEEKLKNYPGSPFFARFYLGKNDRLRLSELHPEDIKALNGFFEKDPRIKMFFQDGYQSLKALLPPPERRGIVLIDPPFERRDEFKAIIEGLKEAQKRFAHGIYAIWYPLKEMKIVDQFYKELSCLGFGNILRLEMTIHREPQEEGLKGCGMTILNPPWQLEEKMKKVLPRFLDYLNAKGTIVINNQKNSPS